MNAARTIESAIFFHWFASDRSEKKPLGGANSAEIFEFALILCEASVSVMELRMVGACP